MASPAADTRHGVDGSGYHRFAGTGFAQLKWRDLGSPRYRLDAIVDRADDLRGRHTANLQCHSGHRIAQRLVEADPLYSGRAGADADGVPRIIHGFLHHVPLMYIVGTVSLLFTYAVGQSAFGSRRWIPIPHTGIHLQVSEFVKLVIILLVARYLTDLRRDD